MPDTILKVKNLNKKFYSKNGVINAIDNVSFELEKGKVLGLVGESGSGKTTIGRTIMNLHTADSGIIEIDGKKYSGKLNRVQRKELYRNVQMIFQDPYSSLNGQKNIKAILEESLQVKGMKKDLLYAYTVDRKDVFRYFGMSFAEFFWKKYWAYRNYANKTALDYYAIIQEELSKIEIDTSNTIVEEWTKIDQAVFENKKEANTLILLKLNDFLGSLFIKWNEFQKKVANGKFEDADEKKLYAAKDNLSKIEKEIKHSKEYYKAIGVKKDLLSKIKAFNDNLEVLKNNFKSDIKAKKRDLRKIISNDKSEIRYSTSIKVEESQKLGLYLDRIILNVLKQKELKDKDIYLEFDELYIKMTKKIYLANANFYDKIKKIESFTEAEVIEANELQPMVERIIELAAKNDKNNKEKISKLESKLNIVNKSIADIELNDSKRDLSKLNNAKDEATKKLEEAKEYNENEIKSYREDSKIKAEKIIAKNKVKTAEDSIKLLNYRKESEEKVKALLGEVLTNKNFNELEFKTSKAAAKSIKSKYKANLKQNKDLEAEIKRVFKKIDIAKKLFSIDSESEKPLNYFTKYKITKLLTLMKIFETLEEVGLNKGHVYGYPHEFSGGMRQRVGIARAIISNPKIIIADEPIAALDLSIQAQIVNLLSDLKKTRNLSVIFIAHDLAMVEFNSDNVLIMHLGKIVEKGSSDKIFSKPIHPYTKNLISSMPSLETLTSEFKENNFIPTYLTKYTVTNNPKFHEISKNHFVLADEEQIKTWTKRK